MRFNIFLCWLLILTSPVSGQKISKHPASGEYYMQSLIQNNNTGFIGLTTKDNLGYHNLMLVRLDDSLHVIWTKLFFDSANHQPVFLKQASTSNFLIGSYSNSSALLMETDSSGSILHQWNILDSIQIVDAIRTSDGATYLLFEKNNNSFPLGNLRSTGIGYISPSGTLQYLYWSPNSSHHSDPVNFAESSSSSPFFIFHRESLNYWDCWISKTDSSGNLTNNYRFEIAYDIQLLRRRNLNYIISGLTLLSSTGPPCNFFIQLNSSGNLTSIFGIQFSGFSNPALNGMKCVESADGGLFCAGTLDNKIIFLKIASNNTVFWAYSLPNSTNYQNVNTVLNCTDHGFLIEGYSNNTCELIKCDSNGVSNCPQAPAVCLLIHPTFFHSPGTNGQQQLLNFSYDTTQFSPLPGSYVLTNECLPTSVNDKDEKQSELTLNFSSGILSIKWKGYSKMNSIPFELFDLKGNLVLKGNIEKMNDDTFIRSLSLENVSTGIYFVKVKTEKTIFVSKFLKNN